jgi:hypothetical protein
MPKAFLPKQIREDPRLKEVFGDSEPQLEVNREPRPKGNPNYWNEIRETWIRKQQPRICANPKCGKEFLPKNPVHRFCTPQCYDRFRRNGKPIDPEKAKICECGRHSNHLAIARDGKLKCSFCLEREQRFLQDLKEIEHVKARREATKKRRAEERIQRLGEKKTKLLEQKKLEQKKNLEVLPCICTKCGSRCSETEIALFHGLCVDCYFQRCVKKV